MATPANQVSSLAGTPEEIAANKAAYQAAHPQSVQNQTEQPSQTSQTVQTQTKQQAFDSANPAGTPISNINHNPVQQQQPVQQVSQPTQIKQTIQQPEVTTPQQDAGAQRVQDFGNVPSYSQGMSQQQKDAFLMQNANNASTQQMMSNVSQMAQGTPNFYSDRSQFEKMTGYAGKQQSERDYLDSVWQSNQPKTVNDFMAAIQSGRYVPPSLRNTNAYAQAQSQYAQYSQFQYADGDALYDAVKSGTLVPGTPVWNMISQYNPTAIQQYQQKSRLATFANSANSASNSYINGMARGTSTISDIIPAKKVTADPMATLQEISDKLIKGIDPNMLQEYKQEYQNSGIVEYRNQLVQAQKDLATLQNQRSKITEDTINDLKGTGASASYIAALAGERGRDIDRAIESKSIEVQSLGQSLTAIGSSIKDQFSMRKDIDSLALQQMQEAAGINQNLEQQQFQVQNYRLQQAFQNPNMDSQDPQVSQIAMQRAIDSENAFAQQYGIPVVRSAPQIISQVRDYAQKNGTSIGEAFQKVFVEPRHNSPEYRQALQSIQTKAMAQEWKEASVNTYNPQTGMMQQVPVFYRTKGTGGFEVRDVSGNQIDPSVLGQGIPGQAQSGASAYQALVASSNPIGVYATGDMDGSRHAALYQQAQSQGLDNFVSKYKGTPITAEMITSSGAKYGVDPLAIAATMALDSSMGTNWYGKSRGLPQNYNFGNVGQTDEKSKAGISVPMGGVQEGIDAVAKNLAKRQAALGLTTAQSANVNQNSQKIADLLAKYDSAGTGRSGLSKVSILTQLQNLGIGLQYVEPAVQAQKYLSKSDPTAFQHLNMLEDEIKQLPNGGTTLTQNIVNSVLKFFGDPNVSNMEMMQGLAGDELSKFYGANGVTDRQAANRYFSGLTKDAMLSQIDQARLASSTKAEAENQKYKQVTGIDHPTFENIKQTIGKYNPAFNQDSIQNFLNGGGLNFSSVQGNSKPVNPNDVDAIYNEWVNSHK